MENPQETQTTQTASDEVDSLVKLVSSLPKEKGWSGDHYVNYQGHWYPELFAKDIIAVHNVIKTRATDLILVTMPKSGTVWLKALAFAVANRQKCKELTEHPLLVSNPHDLVPWLEADAFAEQGYFPESRRIFSTHVPYNMLSKSIKESECRVIYLCRNPYDILISLWQFIGKPNPLMSEHQPIDDAVDKFCKGVSPFGPIWDHVLGYCSEEQPNKILVLMFEDLKKDPVLGLKRIAEFIGVPFSPEEEKEGVIEEISRLCNFKTMKEVEANKTGSSLLGHDNKSIFRKGEVGDWANHLSPEMKERLDEMIEEKFGTLASKFKI